MIILYIVGIIILIILVLFTFPQYSPIPYFPSNKKDLPLILKALDIKNDQVVMDLGAGDGVVIFEAATEAHKKKLNTQFIAIDINPVLVGIMQIRCLFHPNRNNILILRKNMFSLDLNTIRFPRRSSLTPRNDIRFNVKRLTFYMYISPRFLGPMAEKIKKLDRKKQIISYFYPIPSLKTKEKITRGIHNIYKYTI